MHTVIVGGGFAGVKAAVELSKKQLGKVTLISDEPYFLHHATLYATATGRSTTESVAQLEDIFASQHDIELIQDSMTSIDEHRKLVVGKKKSYPYDSLVIAIGVVTTYFGIDGMAKHSYGIKTLEEVAKFKDHLHKEIVADKHLDKNYVIVGAGPTGVELAGALVTYLKTIASAHMVKRANVHITLVEAAPRILPRGSETASRVVQKRLEKLGVKVLVNHKVEALSSDTITIDGKKVPTETAVWTSGVANHPFFAAHDHMFTFGPGGRIIVNEYMEALPDVYVIGDNASIQYGGMAKPALDHGTFTADHLARKMTARPLKKFVPKQPISATPVGDGWAYVEWHNVYVAGRTGYLIRRLIELYGYRALLPGPQALGAWHAHSMQEETCDICRPFTTKTVVKA